MIFPALQLNCCLLLLSSCSPSPWHFWGRWQHRLYQSSHTDVKRLWVPAGKSCVQRHPDLSGSSSNFFTSQIHPRRLYSLRKNNVIDGFGVTDGNQLLFKCSIVTSINLAFICPYKELVVPTSACQGSDTTFNLNSPVERKQRFGLTLTSRYFYFPASTEFDFRYFPEKPHTRLWYQHARAWSGLTFHS